MDFTDIFAEFYAQFRGDNQIPDDTDPQWAVAAYYGNTAIRRWSKVDGEKWDQLWSTAITEGFVETWTGTASAPTTASFDCPDNMDEPGGFIQMTDPVSGAFIHIDVVKLQDVQFQTQSGPYAYFTGNAQQGFQVTIVMTGTSQNGWTIDFPLYKKPTFFDTSQTSAADGTINEDGSTVTEVPDSSFIINYILAYFFRTAQNYPSYQTAKSDAETALKGMQTRNGVGTPGDTWNLNSQNKTGSFGV